MRDFTAPLPIFETSVMSIPGVFIPYLHRRLVCKGVKGSFGIITPYPLLYPYFSLFKVVKLFSLKQLFSHSAVIAFHIAIIERLSRWYHLLFYPPFSNYPLEFFRPKFRPILSSEYSWRALKAAKLVKIIGNCFSGKGEFNPWFKSSTAKGIHNIEYPEFLSRGYPVMKEIPRPYMSWKLRRCGFKSPGDARILFIRPDNRFLKVLIAIDSINSLMIDFETLDPQFCHYKSITPGRMLHGYGFYPFTEFTVIVAAMAIKRGSWEFKSFTEHGDGKSEWIVYLHPKYPQLLSVQKFFLIISLWACISNSFSARSLLSLEFSSSRTLRRFASEAFKPLYFCFHRYRVLELIPYFLATAETELLGKSASARILIIWSTENLLGLIYASPFVFFVSNFLHNNCLIFGEQINGERYITLCREEVQEGKGLQRDAPSCRSDRKGSSKERVDKIIKVA